MMPLIYDFVSDNRREATQADVDLLEKTVRMLADIRQAVHEDILNGVEIGPSTKAALVRFARERFDSGWAAGNCGTDLLALGLQSPWVEQQYLQEIVDAQQFGQLPGAVAQS